MQTLFGDRLSRHAVNASCAPALALPGRDISYAELVARVRSVCREANRRKKMIEEVRNPAVMVAA